VPGIQAKHANWLAMQHAYDLWVARNNLDLGAVSKADLDAA